MVKAFLEKVIDQRFFLQTTLILVPVFFTPNFLELLGICPIEISQTTKEISETSDFKRLNAFETMARFLFYYYAVKIAPAKIIISLARKN